MSSQTWVQSHAGWSTAADFERFGQPAQLAWQTYQDQAARQKGKELKAPDGAALSGASAARAVEIIYGPDEAMTVNDLRDLIARTPVPKGKTQIPPVGLQHLWNVLSGSAQGRFLHAMDPGLHNIDRLRYRSGNPTARQPHPRDTDAIAARAKCVPQLLWPEWTTLLLPTQGFEAEPFRILMSACLFLVGQPSRSHSAALAHLNPGRRLHTSGLLMKLTESGHQSVLAALCYLADYLDEHGSPIDYQRRRALVPPNPITAQEWRQLCHRTGTHPGDSWPSSRGGNRYLHAQRYLYQTMTGADLSDPAHALAWRSPDDRNRSMLLTASLTQAQRDALLDHGEQHLHQLGIEEPLTWHPPTDCCPNLTDHPGHARDDTDPDFGAVHLSMISEDGGADPALERVPRPVRQRAKIAASAAEQAIQQARALLTREFFQREHLGAGKRLRQLETETGIPRRLIALRARELGITVLPRVRTLHPIDETWLREQYIQRKRSLAEIAADLGISVTTVAHTAHAYEIPVRPAGIVSHSQMISVLPTAVPDDVRRAVEGSVGGWRRLQRFQAALACSTLREASERIGVNQTVLAKQFQRLERDIGAQLFHRSSARGQQPMRPTPRGQALLEALDRPCVREHAQCPGSAGPHGPTETGDRPVLK